MSALKWHLCDRLWEIRPPMRIVPPPLARTKDEADRPDDEQAATVSDDDERAARKSEPIQLLRVVAM